MVKKLLKHEIIAYSRTILPIYIILLGIAVLTRMVQFFESDTISYGIVIGSSIFMLVTASIICTVMTSFTGITRFYKNLFTNEGYLSLTLPVTASQHIFSKLFIAVIFNIFSVIAVIVSVLVATLGDVANEIIKAAGYLIKLFFQELSINGAFYVIEVLALFIVSLISAYLLFYACISVGQLAKKNRILAAFGVYFAHYAISQVLSTMFVMFFAILAGTPIFDTFIDFTQNYPEASRHIGFCLSLLLYLVLGAIYYFVTYKIMTRKLNIE